MRRLVIGMLAASLPVLAFAAEVASQKTVVPPGEKVAGRTQAEWSREWWQWASAFDDDESPIADRTGGRCHLRQDGDVWFLAGTYGTQRTIRKCTVPAGRYLFFPLINYVVYPREGHALSCEGARAEAARLTDDVSALVLEVDGKRFAKLESHRQATTRCFDLLKRAGGGLEPSAGNGYYIMLRPLPPGTHTINFGGIMPDMMQAVTYTLFVR